MPHCCREVLLRLLEEQGLEDELRSAGKVYLFSYQDREGLVIRISRKGAESAFEADACLFKIRGVGLVPNGSGILTSGTPMKGTSQEEANAILQQAVKPLSERGVRIAC